MNVSTTLPPDSAARVAKMQGEIDEARSALLRLVQVVCAGTPREAHDAAARIETAAHRVAYLRRMREPLIRREHEFFAAPRIEMTADEYVSLVKP